MIANPKSRYLRLIDRISIFTGQIAAWLTLAMVLTTFTIVILRYALDTGAIWLQESIIWMHAMIFMLGAAYTLQQDEHVRVDVFYRKMTQKHRALVNLLGILCFLFPLCIVLIYESFDYVRLSWIMREVSRNAGGLTYPFTPLLKTSLLIMPIALLLQSTSNALRAFLTLRDS